MTPSKSEAERIVGDLLHRTRAETARADNKASILLAGVLALAGGMTAALGAARWSPDQLPWLLLVPFWLAVGSALAGVVLLTAAVYPRATAERPDGPAVIGFFGDVTALGSVNELRRALEESELRLLDVWVDQTWQASRIIAAKYGCIRWAVRALPLGGACGGLVLAITVFAR